MMQSEQVTEPNTQNWHIPATKEPLVLADPRIEDYLDHVCAPLVGVVPYSERQQVREAKRAELEATIQAHLELGSSLEHALDLALSAPTVRKAMQAAVAPTVQVQETSPALRSWQRTQRVASRIAFGNALAGLPLLCLVNATMRGGDYAWKTSALTMAAIPLLACIVLGYMGRGKIGTAWMKASLKTAPLLAWSYLMLGTTLATLFASVEDIFPLIIGYIAEHTVVSAVAGLVGIGIGKVLRKSVNRLRRPRSLHSFMA